MEEDHKTKEARDEGVEKHSCQIELRGIHLKLVYYNGKQVLCAYSMVHVTAVLHVRNEDELAHTYTYMSSKVMYNLGGGPRFAYVSASARHQNNKLLWCPSKFADL